MNGLGCKGNVKLLISQSLRGEKFVFDALSLLAFRHQAATLFEGLAWCFSLKPGLRPVKPLRGDLQKATVLAFTIEIRPV